ncbi:winged helix-turn-helix domain-containing protein [Ferribacterium limneticum]|nr:winged helix-turn-helix domain-containing protein [Ferribacterium limneticum]UCV34436.1 winged helix-turn-helix domain-containing protein [Ferribacterium limneticum]
MRDFSGNPAFISRQALGNILVVDEEQTARSLVGCHLLQGGFSVDFVESAAVAESAIRLALPDLLILDCKPLVQSGLGLIRKIRGAVRTRDIPIVMLSARGAERDKVLGLDAGADDYITKPFGHGELMARIRAVLRRRMPHIASEAIKVGTLTINPATYQVSAGSKPISLGPTDFRLLTFLMSHPERMYTRRQLLDEVWGDHAYVSERTVDVHILKLRSGLRDSGNHCRVETVRGGGYRFRGE